MKGSSSGTEAIGVAVLGATGYLGIELVRLIAAHPRLRLVHATSEQYAGRALREVYPFLGEQGSLELEVLDARSAAARAEVVFSSLPHATAAETVAQVFRQGRTVIDVSADFRLRDRGLYERTYRTTHPAPELLEQAVYGLTELHRDELAGARLVANPGCYPTGALLGIVPILHSGAKVESIVIDAKSGLSGAGRTAQTDSLFVEVNENSKAYQAGTHRHAPEIEQEIARANAAAAPPVFFVPHLVPLTRGILSTIYLRVAGLDGDRVAEIFARAYRGSPFIDVRSDGSLPELRDVRGTNRCAIGWRAFPAAEMLCVVTAIDNLMKGGSGQAIQNLNVIMGWKEDLGLDGLGWAP